MVRRQGQPACPAFPDRAPGCFAGHSPDRLAAPVARTVLRKAHHPRRAHARGDSIATRSSRIGRAGPDLPPSLAGLLDRQSFAGLAQRPALRVSHRASRLSHRAASPLRAWPRPCRREAARTATPSKASPIWTCAISTGPWLGWARFFRMTGRTEPHRLHPAPTRTSSSSS